MRIRREAAIAIAVTVGAVPAGCSRPATGPWTLAPIVLARSCWSDQKVGEQMAVVRGLFGDVAAIAAQVRDGPADLDAAAVARLRVEANAAAARRVLPIWYARKAEWCAYTSGNLIVITPCASEWATAHEIGHWCGLAHTTEHCGLMSTGDRNGCLFPVLGVDELAKCVAKMKGE
jgi:hypothetical protein